jgi:succinate-semialdehyde dehydrogenase/glutarate-semialdehyde dehydrogenase
LTLLTGHFLVSVPKERAAVLRRWFDLVMENQDDLARLMTLSRAALAESRGEVVRRFIFEWFGEEVKRVYGDTIPGIGRQTNV